MKHKPYVCPRLVAKVPTLSQKRRREIEAEWIRREYLRGNSIWRAAWVN